MKVLHATFASMIVLLLSACSTENYINHEQVSHQTGNINVKKNQMLSGGIIIAKEKLRQTQNTSLYEIIHLEDNDLQQVLGEIDVSFPELIQLHDTVVYYRDSKGLVSLLNLATGSIKNIKTSIESCMVDEENKTFCSNNATLKDFSLTKVNELVFLKGSCESYSECLLQKYDMLDEKETTLLDLSQKFEGSLSLLHNNPSEKIYLRLDTDKSVRYQNAKKELTVYSYEEGSLIKKEAGILVYCGPNATYPCTEKEMSENKRMEKILGLNDHTCGRFSITEKLSDILENQVSIFDGSTNQDIPRSYFVGCI